MKTKPSTSNTGLLRNCIRIQALAFDTNTSKRIVRQVLCGKNVTPEHLGHILKALKITPKDIIVWEVVK